jgi:hypothetical protein
MEIPDSSALYVGRGVWESNPPGAAPSDPPAVLKTVRPTGAPTPPYVWVYFVIPMPSCQAWLCALPKLLNALYIHFCQVFDHYFGFV